MYLVRSTSLSILAASSEPVGRLVRRRLRSGRAELARRSWSATEDDLASSLDGGEARVCDSKAASALASLAQSCVACTEGSGGMGEDESEGDESTPR